jgi:hypothetical protein
MRLSDIAHGRSGDKGDKANVGIRVYDPDDYDFLRSYLTEPFVTEVFSEHLQAPEPGAVDRYELPEISAVNFVLHDALGGGASESLRTDSQGKTYAALLLRRDISEEYPGTTEPGVADQ